MRDRSNVTVEAAAGSVLSATLKRSRARRTCLELPAARAVARRRTKGAAPRGSKPGKRAPEAKHGRIDCEIREGVPTVQGKARAHYASGQSGGLMLVFERRAGERIRINATTEVVILEVSQEHVKVAVETSRADEG